MVNCDPSERSIGSILARAARQAARIASRLIIKERGLWLTFNQAQIQAGGHVQKDLGLQCRAFGACPDTSLVNLKDDARPT
ncbi:hypothetical protein GCM10007207_12410 [Asaia siamensis]|uniref:Uncharacterized protein n=1 Tax=Asaia siamensis TaxID=110479 RepID=A0ABQ1LSY3_9PROT|nr:hypothetical protein AA0323_0629 [Asaia siamensis NRIC 0323]GGC28476.1 hypothetical protein GCM10007207_12410 [Asaia siamensis]